MKHLKVLFIGLITTACLSCAAMAVTPDYTPPKLPDVPKIEVEVPKIKFSDDYFSNLLRNVKIPAKYFDLIFGR
nr:MAG TPA: hypothetical protein [Caudoviricetes sp.]